MLGWGGILGQKKGKICYRGSEAGGDEWVLVFGDQWRCDGVLLVWESTMMGVATVLWQVHPWSSEHRLVSGVAAAVDGGRNQQRRVEMLSCIVRAERFRNPAMDVKSSDQNGALFEWKGGQESRIF